MPAGQTVEIPRCGVNVLEHQLDSAQNGWMYTLGLLAIQRLRTGAHSLERDPRSG